MCILSLFGSRLYTHTKKHMQTVSMISRYDSTRRSHEIKPFHSIWLILTHEPVKNYFYCPSVLCTLYSNPTHHISQSMPFYWLLVLFSSWCSSFPFIFFSLVNHFGRSLSLRFDWKGICTVQKVQCTQPIQFTP